MVGKASQVGQQLVSSRGQLPIHPLPQQLPPFVSDRVATPLISDPNHNSHSNQNLEEQNVCVLTLYRYTVISGQALNKAQLLYF